MRQSLLILFFGVALALSISAQAETVTVPLEWKSVDGAGGYRIEIQSPVGEPVFTQDVSEAKASLELAPGIYRLRISSLNRFGKVDSSTSWAPLNVKKIPTPTIISVVPPRVQEDEPLSLTVQASGIDEKTTWYLVSIQGDTIELTASAVGAGWLLKGASPGQGSYTLRAVGKTGKVGEQASALTVVAHDPVVASVNLQAQGTGTPVVEVRGRYLYPGVKVDFRADGGSASVVQTGTDPTLMKGTLPLAGEYSITVFGLDGSPRGLPGTFSVLPRPQIHGVIPRKDEKSGQWKVELAVRLAGPDLKILIDAQGTRIELPTQALKPGRVAFLVPSDWAAGTYRLWAANRQGLESSAPDSLTIGPGGIVKGSPAFLDLQSETPGAEARVDGSDWVKVPAQVNVGAGVHQVVWKDLGPGRSPLKSPGAVVDLDAHETKKVVAAYATVALDNAPPLGTPARIESAVAGDVYLGSSLLGPVGPRKPLLVENLGLGSQTLRLVVPGGSEVSQSLDLSLGAPVNVVFVPLGLPGGPSDSNAALQESRKLLWAGLDSNLLALQSTASRLSLEDKKTLSSEFEKNGFMAALYTLINIVPLPASTGSILQGTPSWWWTTGLRAAGYGLTISAMSMSPQGSMTYPVLFLSGLLSFAVGWSFDLLGPATYAIDYNQKLHAALY